MRWTQKRLEHCLVCMRTPDSTHCNYDSIWHPHSALRQNCIWQHLALTLCSMAKSCLNPLPCNAMLLVLASSCTSLMVKAKLYLTSLPKLKHSCMEHHAYLSSTQKAFHVIVLAVRAQQPLADVLCHTADEFVEEWNGRRLFAKYYAGMTGGASIRRTKHQWGIRQGQPRLQFISNWLIGTYASGKPGPALTAPLHHLSQLVLHTLLTEKVLCLLLSVLPR